MAQIDRFLDVLVKNRGSDLHLAVGNPPIIRVNGSLTRINTPGLTSEQMKFLLGEIMDERQRGEFLSESDLDFAYQTEAGRFRVNVLDEKNGWSAVFREIPTRIPSPDDIGMPAAIRGLATIHKGLVLVTGATGSGKSTTLAALIDLINQSRQVHILTLEDPIEFVHTSQRALVRQREIGHHTKNFARALKAALREDPDVILVGELRDLETIQLAITAAETGHLVLGTLHTMSAPKTIDRMIDVFPPEQQEQIRVQMAEALAAVISQQLLPRKGGKGRVAAYEILLRNSAVASLIREGKQHQLRNTMQTYRKDGMQLMDLSLIDLARRGIVDFEEAASRAHDRRYVEAELKRQTEAPPA
jgi:twitching motility protein PilT